MKKIVTILWTKNLFNELIEGRSSGFRDLEKEINSNNLPYKYKTEGISSKDYSNYQNLIKLFKGLRDGNINPKEILKYQINLKSDLGEIKKKEIKKSK